MRNTTLILAALALVLFLSEPAQAELVLYLQSGGDVKTVVDDAIAGYSTAQGTLANTADNNGVAGVIGFNGSVGNFNVNVTTGISKPVIGPRKIDLNSVNVTSDNPGDLFIFLLDTDYTHPLGGNLNLVSKIGGVAGGTLEAKAGWNDSNSEFFFNNINFFGPFGAGPFSDTEVGAINITGGAAFALGEAVWITHTRAGQISSFDFETVVPEPVSLALVGLGALALIRRRRKTA